MILRGAMAHDRLDARAGDDDDRQQACRGERNSLHPAPHHGMGPLKKNG